VVQEPYLANVLGGLGIIRRCGRRKSRESAVLINLGETTSHSQRLNSGLETLYQLALRFLTPSRPTERVRKRIIDRWAETEASPSRI